MPFGVKVLKGIYFPNTSIWEAKKGRKASWGWVSILKGRDFLNKHKAWHIRNGRKVKVCGDKWLHSGDRIWINDEEVQQANVSVLLTADEDNWNTAKVNDLLPSETASKILATHIHTQLADDTAFWPYSGDGAYTLKSGYKITQFDVGDGRSIDNPSTNPENSLWKYVWKANVMPKIKNFVWRLLIGALPTRVNLLKRGLGFSSSCPICSSNA